MIGYGEMVIEVARQSEHKVVELRPASLFGRLLPDRIQGLTRKVANNVDRFLVTPLKFVGKKADIVHIVDPGNVVYLPFIRHEKSIVTVHDMIPYLARDGKLKGWKPSRTGRWLMRRITAQLAKVDHIVCVSHATKRDYQSYVNLPEQRVSVVYNAVFQPMERASTLACAELRERLGLPPDKPLVLHVGRNWYKNRETVLEVVEKVRAKRPDVQLLMVGVLTPALAEQVERRGLRDALHVLDFVSREDMATLYTTASVLLFPSHYEGFGLPLLEAQMCGTPVVSSDAGSLTEVRGMLVSYQHPLNSEGYASDIIALLDSNFTPSRTSGNETVSRSFHRSLWQANHLEMYSTAEDFNAHEHRSKVFGE